MSAQNDPVGSLRRSKGGFLHYIKVDQPQDEPCWECIDAYGPISDFDPGQFRTDEQIDMADDTVLVYSPVPEQTWKFLHDPEDKWKPKPVQWLDFSEVFGPLLAEKKHSTGNSVTIAGITLNNVHDRGPTCEEACVIHNPTEHHMSTWKLHYRDDRNIFERICEHGIGHPDPDQYPYWDSTDQKHQGVHGCDGCCSTR